MGDVIGIDGEGQARPNHAPRGLPNEVKQRIVTLFAQFQGVGPIHRTIREEFGLALDHRTIAQYDPSRPQARIGRRLRDVYASAREAWVGKQATIGVSMQNQRLRLIERAIEGAERGKDWGNVARLLELAAKEMGGVLTNVSKVEHGGAVGHLHLTAEDARAELARRLNGVVNGGLLEAKPLEDNEKPSDLT